MKINLVNVVTTLSVLATIAWIVGMGITINDQLLTTTSSSQEWTTTPNEPEEQTSGLFILALGDSLTRGTGDTTGQGYVTYVLEDLKSSGDNSINLSNLAVGGFTSEQLIDQLQESEIQRQIAQADMIFMTIGGNDLFQGGQALMAYSSEMIEETTQQYKENLTSIYTTIESANPNAVVYHVGLYDPFQELDNSNQTSSTVRQWNFESAEIAASFDNVVYVPSYDLFELNVSDFLFSDQFHPNNRGYELIGRRLASLLSLEQGGQVND
ncbi:GDSL-type esterase/lipase family protein [Salipaludibacillus daqingensis]|uniref:GDSL-type esterase/lipase family protein n=1 Tax=Salipaludibacillus daqingensis TaxID=3041001 RepID=UPI002476545A|nr:GDSL-type esterase/lipase family protein [Salipaludibacillus daqingensis]